MNEQQMEKRIKQYSQNRTLYENFAKQVLDIIKAIIEQEHPNLKIAVYSKRAKDVQSLKKKLLKDKYTEDSEITDLAGVRVITYSKRDIPYVTEIIQKNFKIDDANSVDKTLGLGTDKVGYRGHHYIVLFDDDRIKMPENRKFINLKCEVQVTSLIAHTWSEITHEKGYKFEGDLPTNIERRKNLLAGMLELADLEMDAYVDEFDEYVAKVNKEMKEGCLTYDVNSMTLQQFMIWKFPHIQPHLFRDIELILHELNLFGVDTIQKLNEMINSDFIEEIRNSKWRSLDGIIRNILIIHDAEKYFDSVWNPSMNQMNKMNYQLYEKFNVNIKKICEEKKINVV